MSELLSVCDVARELRCTRHHVRHLIERGDLPFIDIGLGKKRIARIPQAALDDWLRRRTEIEGR